MEMSGQLHGPAPLASVLTGWVAGGRGCRARVNTVAKRKIPVHTGNQTPLSSL
jgi:hypothetical protein